MTNRLAGEVSRLDRALQTYIAEWEASPEFKILNALVQQPDSDESVADAVRQIVELTSASAMSSDQRREVGNQAYNTSCCLVEVVERTPPSQQSKLVQFLYQLREKTVTDPITSEPLKVDGEVVWTDLPTLGYTWADEINSFCLEDTPDKLQRWENLSAYFARLTASSSNMDFSRTGIWVLQTAFEPEKPLERELAAIRMACFWLIYAADILWANANGRDNNGKDVGCGKRFQGRKWKGFSRDRWSFWEERLLEAQVIYTSGETKELIEDALAQMKRASTE